MSSSYADFPSCSSSKATWPCVQDAPNVPSRMPDGAAWPRISIITPSYNQAIYLEETIRSVLLQGYPDLEYIIMDGGSTDGSVEIIRKYDPWLTFWEAQPDRGQSHAINKGLEKATGKIVAWLNSDDYYCQGALMKAASFFAKNPRASALIGQCNQIDSNQNHLRVRPGADFKTERLIQGGEIPGQPAVFLNMDLVKEIGKIREDLNFVLDWEYWLRIGTHYPGQEQTTLEILAVERLWAGRKTVLSAGNETAQEKRKILSDLFKGSDLSGKLQKIAYSETYWRQGFGQFIAGQNQAARKSFREAFKCYPSLLSFIKLVIYVPASLLGYRLSKRITDLTPEWIKKLWQPKQ